MSILAAFALALSLAIAAGEDAGTDAPGAAAAALQCSWVRAGPIGSATADLERVAELAGSTPVVPHMFLRWSSTTEFPLCQGGHVPHPSALAAPEHTGLEIEALPFSSRTYVNSGYPDDRNDGALWQGRGVSTELTGGARLRWKFFSAAFSPGAAWQENRWVLPESGFEVYGAWGRDDHSWDPLSVLVRAPSGEDWNSTVLQNGTKSFTLKR